MNASFLSVLPQPLDRQHLAAWACAAATASAAALLFLPKGFAVFGGLLLVSTLMAPAALVPAWQQRRPAQAVLAILVGSVLLITIASPVVNPAIVVAAPSELPMSRVPAALAVKLMPPDVKAPEASSSVPPAIVLALVTPPLATLKVPPLLTTALLATPPAET